METSTGKSALVASRSEEQPGAAVGAGATRSRATRIFIVEDNHDSADSLMMLLELLGFEVGVAHDGLTALQLAHKSVPDVMLIDIGLPGIDGHEVARRVRRDPDLMHVTLIALTGYGMEEDREQALAAGFDHHLVKPVDPDILKRLISS